VISLSEIHGLVVHLPLLAVPTLALLAVLRWRGRGGDLVERAEPWVFGAAAGGAAIAVLSGLTVFQSARTELRGSTQWLALGHLGVGIGLVLVLGAVALWRWWAWRQGSAGPSPSALAVTALAALALAVTGGFLGGRMVYQQGVGVDAGGQFAQTARGAAELAAGLAQGDSRVALGRSAFQTGLGCASCHGMQAQGGRAPGLSGGIELEAFRHTHGAGLFPTSVVSDPMLAAIEAWLETNPAGHRFHGDALSAAVPRGG